VVRSITTGATQVEYTPIGHTTNLASRLQSIARTGSIVVTEATRKLVEGYFALKPLGATKIKGVSEPVNVYEVPGIGPLRTRLQRAVGRGLTKFVGREREIEALKHTAELAKGGRGQIVAAMAEPGVGKSLGEETVVETAAFVGPIAVPHFLQNRAPGLTDALHAGQISSSFAPHPSQNEASPGSSRLQNGQRIGSPLARLVPKPARTAEGGRCSVAPPSHLVPAG
jgi:hypothetical protein